VLACVREQVYTDAIEDSTGHNPCVGAALIVLERVMLKGATKEEDNAEGGADCKLVEHQARCIN
jgi:hypothetical protein